VDKFTKQLITDFYRPGIVLYYIDYSKKSGLDVVAKKQGKLYGHMKKTFIETD